MAELQKRYVQFEIKIYYFVMHAVTSGNVYDNIYFPMNNTVHKNLLYKHAYIHKYKIIVIYH